MLLLINKKIKNNIIYRQVQCHPLGDNTCHASEHQVSPPWPRCHRGHFKLLKYSGRTWIGWQRWMVSGTARPSQIWRAKYIFGDCQTNWDAGEVIWGMPNSVMALTANCQAPATRKQSGSNAYGKLFHHPVPVVHPRCHRVRDAGLHGLLQV